TPVARHRDTDPAELQSLPYRSSGLERQLGDEPNRLDLAAHAERGHARRLPLGEALADALARSAERHLVDESVRHRGLRLGLAAGQVVILDLRRRFLVAVAADH